MSSTVIHVTIEDDRQALAIIATLQNQGYQVSIDLDEVPSFVEPNYMDLAEVEIRERLWSEDNMLRRKLEREQRNNHVIAYGAKVHFDGSDYWINGERVSAKVFDETMRERRRRRDEKAAKAAEAIERVHCPKCSAKVGERCISNTGKRRGGNSVHLDREMALIATYRDGDHAVPAVW